MEFRGSRHTNESILVRLRGRSPRSLTFWNTRADDDLLAALGPQPKLEELTIRSDRITAAGLGRVLASTPLASLFLQYAPQVDDALLPWLGRCPTLHELYLNGTSITDAELRHVGKLPNLWSFIAETDLISDAGVEAIASDHIDLFSTTSQAVTGAGFQSWRVTEKACLYLDSSGLTDAGLETIATSFGRLWNLTFNDTAVTDAGVRSLAGQEPTSIRIARSAVTSAGARWLLDHLPLQELEVDDSQLTRSEAGQLERSRRHLRIYVSEGARRPDPIPIPPDQPTLFDA